MGSKAEKGAQSGRVYERVYDRAESSRVILEAVSNGRTLRSICAEEGMPTSGTFLGWVMQDDALAERYRLARGLGLDVMADEIVEISNTPKIGTKTVSKVTGLEITEADMTDHRRLQIDARKWLLAKMAPKKYGDRIEVDANVKVDAVGDLRAFLATGSRLPISTEADDAE